MNFLISLEATHVLQEPFSLMDLLVRHNTFYDRPKLRFPFYDEKGRGRTIYGFGGRSLYNYTVFDLLEGYF